MTPAGKDSASSSNKTPRRTAAKRSATKASAAEDTPSTRAKATTKARAANPAAEAAAAAAAAAAEASASARRASAGRPASGAARAAGRVPDDAAVSALLDQLTETVAALPELLDMGEEQRRARAEAARALLRSRELTSATRLDPDLGKAVASAEKDLERRDADAEQAISELREATGQWLESLKSLQAPRG